jgi:hypothetical protein
MGDFMTREEEAELLVAGIRQTGVDVDDELRRLDQLPAGEKRRLIDEYLIVGLDAELWRR